MDKEQALEILNQKIEQFIEQHGEMEASRAFQSAMESLDAEDLETLKLLASEEKMEIPQDIQEVTKALGLGWKGLKWLGKKAGQALGIIAPAAATAVGTAAGKAVDQDVNIADQEMDVSVIDKRVGQQLADMRKMLSDIRTILSTGLSYIDLSVDDLVGTVSPGKNVRASQSASGAAKKSSPKPKQTADKEKKDSESKPKKKDSKA